MRVLCWLRWRVAARVLAVKVVCMVGVSRASGPLGGVALGDIVELGGSAQSVRLLVDLPDPVADVAVFAVLGELELLVASDGRPMSPLSLFTAVEVFPSSLASARVLAEGAAAYWAPHLPAVDGAMGEVYFRILLPAGECDPVFVVYRGPEAVPFVRSGQCAAGDVSVQLMPRSGPVGVAVPRYTAVVDPVALPLPPLIPLPAPARPVPLAPARR